MRLLQPSCRRAVLMLLGLALACSDSGSRHTGPNPQPTFLSATVAANPENSISAVVTATAKAYDSAWVRYWVTPGQSSRTPAFPFGVDSVLALPVLGLDTLSTYSLELNLKAADGTVAAVDTLQFTTGDYPAWIPRATAVGTDTTPGYTLLSYPDGPVIVDNLGKIVWYRFRPGGVLGSWTAQANNVYTWLNAADSSGYYVHDILGNEIGRYSCVGFKTRFHDVYVTAQGDRWLMCDEDRVMDLSGMGGVAGAVVTATVVQHISPSDQVLFEWKTLDHFQITDAPLDTRTGAAVNFTHGNGIALDTDGNLLLSSRTLNEITKIDVTTGSIIWRLGGLANDFTFVNDPKGFFEQQHGLRVVGPDRIQILDNGLSAPSRLVRYHLDPSALTATMEWDFVDSPTTWTIVGGSTQAYPSGRALVSFGREGRVVEVDDAGNKVWELTGIDDIYVFRAQHLSSLYAPGE